MKKNGCTIEGEYEVAGETKCKSAKEGGKNTGKFFRGLENIISSNNCLKLTNHAGKLYRRILEIERPQEERLIYRREELKYNINIYNTVIHNFIIY